MNRKKIIKKEITNYLSHERNWTPALFYVHRTRLISGFMLGIISGAGIVMLTILCYVQYLK